MLPWTERQPRLSHEAAAYLEYLALGASARNPNATGSLYEPAPTRRGAIHSRNGPGRLFITMMAALVVITISGTVWMMLPVKAPAEPFLGPGETTDPRPCYVSGVQLHIPVSCEALNRWLQRHTPSP